MNDVSGPTRTRGCAVQVAWFVAALLACAAPVRAVEPWADPAMPVTGGLQLWLDASRPGAAGPTAGPLARWDDASGQGHALTQPTGPFQPTWIKGDAGVPAAPRVRFDGTDDHLCLNGLELDWGDFTVVAVAAPRSNGGLFRALLAAAAEGRNDYHSGLNIDLGGPASTVWNSLNVEGSGFGGANDLLDGEVPFGQFHRLAVRGAHGDNLVQVIFDGARHGSRPRGAGQVRIDRLRLGCRLFRNEPGPPYEQCFFAGDLAELFVYDRALSNDELAQLDAYLRTKHAALLAADAVATLPIHLLAPGMEVRELPVALPNINDLAYLPDGRLLALGYDGRIHLLSDTDGDGLEDRVEPYWYETQFRSPTAMLLTDDGLYVTASGRVSVLRDTDQDGLPDREDVLVSDWEPGDIATGGGVDAMGIARDANGHIVFGLGCADYTNAYRVRDGVPNYKLASERGTILRLLPDGRREIVCTGIRFPYSLAYNAAGDLFCTDQEGETWLPGGNPLDELNHIEPGRHYGFPPWHEQYLPEVVDEPPTIGFGPQHQSTCGLCFNEPAAGQPVFGPEDWRGDAFVAGYSRGKLWRCRLIKTPAGYVGRAMVLAASEMLLLDVQLTPRGDLLIACHSGLPDWGTGPQGAGRMFQIRYVDREAPQPVAAWPVDTLGVRVALDRPLPADAVPLAAAIRAGATARAGDDFEPLKPPYAVVAAQESRPESVVRVPEIAPGEARRTLRLMTDPQAFRASYALGVTSDETDKSRPSWQFEVDFEHTGVVARWEPAADVQAAPWLGWLPTLDLDVSRALLRGSHDHDELWSRLSQPGRLILETRLVPPRAIAELHLSASGELRVEAQAAESQKESPLEGGSATAVVLPAGIDRLKVELPTSDNVAPALTAAYRPAQGGDLRPWPLTGCHLPWAPQTEIPAAPTVASGLAMADGDWYRGRELFSSQEARCSACHRFEGQGGDVGADLTNLRQRDAASVLRDIREPSAAINPDYVQFAVALVDGRSLAGVVRSAGGDRVQVFDAEARATVLARDEIAELSPLPLSLMPQDIAERLGEEKLVDLVTFLTRPEPKPNLPAGIEPPAPRTAAEIATVVPADRDQAAETRPRPLNVVLVASPQDHGPGEHDYPLWQKQWRRQLSQAPGVRVSEAFLWPEPAHWDLADLVVMYFWNHDWSDARLAQLDAYLTRGGGLVVVHAATIADSEPEKLAERLGLCAHFGPARYRHGPLELKIVAGDDEPLTRGLARVQFYDETYWPLVGDRSRVRVLATADEEGQSHPMVWTYQPPRTRGRVFASILGHYRWTFDDPLFRALLLRGMAWAAGEPVDRFGGLYVPPSAAGGAAKRQSSRLPCGR